MNAVLDRQVSAYEARREEMEREYLGRWVVFHDEDLAGTYDSFEEAAEDAIERFGTGPYLIREVGASRIVRFPASVLSHPV
ncbi:MAG: hypothetical protein F4052_05540 [Dehalococcoidia bacterium]|nr:hypothetical protein [Dehalococcoidia bacterium]